MLRLWTEGKKMRDMKIAIAQIAVIVAIVLFLVAAMLHEKQLFMEACIEAGHGQRQCVYEWRKSMAVRNSR